MVCNLQHMQRQIMDEIKRHLATKAGQYVFPLRRLQELSSKINQVTDDLTKELRRSPSIEEIAQRLDTNVEEVLRLWSLLAYSPVLLREAALGAGRRRDSFNH